MSHSAHGDGNLPICLDRVVLGSDEPAGIGYTRPVGAVREMKGLTDDEKESMLTESIRPALGPLVTIPTINLSGRTAFVSGASRNIGRAVALAFARAGARVAIVAHRNRERLEEVAGEIQALGGEAHLEFADAGDWSEWNRALNRIDAALGPPDIVVNNVGIRPAMAIEDVAQGDWDRVLAVNLRSAFQVIQWAAPGMAERGWGRVVNVSGQDALAGSYHRVPVTSSKGGLIGLTAAVAPFYAPAGVTVNTVVPGFIDTERHTPAWYPDTERLFERALSRVPAKRQGRPEEVADCVLFLCSDMATFITGQTVNVTGGFPLQRRVEWEDVDPSTIERDAQL